MIYREAVDKTGMKLDFKGVKGHPPECPDGDTTEEDEDEEESRLRHRERFFFV